MTNLDATDIVIATARAFGLRPAQLQHKASPRGELGRLVFRSKCQAMRTLRDAGASLPMIARAILAEMVPRLDDRMAEAVRGAKS